MHDMHSKTKKITEISDFSQKNTMLFVVKKDMVFFINRIKLEALLSFLCLLGEFNAEFMNVEYGNITKWLRSKKLLRAEILREISLFEMVCFAKKYIIDEKEKI